MKKTVKRILATVLTVVMLLGLVPVMDLDITASADMGDITEPGIIEGEFEFVKEDGYARLVECHADGDVVIPEYFQGLPVTEISDSAFYYSWSVTSVTIPKTIETISNESFYGCTATEYFVDSENEFFSSDSFGVLYNKDKSRLILYLRQNERTSYSIPDGVKTIGIAAFSNNYNLTDLNISNSVTTIDKRAFAYSEISNITFGSGVQSIAEDAFCDTVVSCFSVSDENLHYSSDSYGVLYNKEKTEIINYPRGSIIEDYIIPDTVTNIGDEMFYGCSNLSSITISESVVSIGDSAFCNTGLKGSINIPESVTYIGDSAFCSTGLESINIPESVTYIGDSAFYGCSSLSGIFVSENNKVFSSDENGVLFNKDKTELILYPEGNESETYTIPDSVLVIKENAFRESEYLYTVSGGNHLETIENYAFHYSEICSVELSETIISIGKGAFRYCRNLYDIAIPDSVISIEEGTFEYCKSLEKVYIPTSVISIGAGAFGSCASLESIFIPENISDICVDELWGEYAFRGCDSLKYLEVDIDNKHYSSDSNGVLYDKEKTRLMKFPENSDITHFEIPDTVSSIDPYAFEDSISLVSVTVPDGVESLLGTFYGCENLVDIILPDGIINISNGTFDGTGYYNDDSNWENGVLYIENYLIEAEREISGYYEVKNGTTVIANYAFSGCDELTEVFLPDSIIALGSDVFTWCDNLEKINLPDTIQEIGSSAFYKCYSLESIVLPKDLKIVNVSVFYECNSLTQIVIPETVEIIEGGAFSSTGLNCVTIPKNVTRIESGAFSKCPELKEIWIDNEEITIVRGAFYQSNQLLDVYFNGTEEQWKNVVIESEEFDGYYYDDPILDATIHFLGESEHVHAHLMTVTKEATCTETGIMTYICSCGDTYTEVIPAAEHSFTHIAEDSTCQTAGCEYDLCSVCGETVNYIELPLGDCTTRHMVIESTCKVQGMEYDVCLVCGKSSNNQVLPLADHTTTHIKVDATCTQEGYEYDLCSVCEKQLNYVELPLAAHQNKHIVIESTCKIQGREYDECTICGASSNNQVLPLTDHIWNDWIVTKEPTTESEGTETRGCSVCGTTETKHIPKLIVIKDNSTGIEIEYSDEYDSGVEIEVEEIFDGDSFHIIDANFDNNQSVVFDINTLKDGIKIQPSGGVKVRIPLPEGFSGEGVVVCHIDTDTNKITDIPAQVVDGYVEFIADHFSYYAIVEELGEVKSVSIDDISMSYKNSATITPTINADSNVNYTVSYSSSNNAVASVDENGKITTNGTGSATITVTVTDENGNVVSDTCEVEVKYKWWQWIIVIVLFGWIWY